MTIARLLWCFLTVSQVLTIDSFDIFRQSAMELRLSTVEQSRLSIDMCPPYLRRRCGKNIAHIAWLSTSDNL